ncbi:YwqG family protein [Bacillus sp. 179-C3.3 HS]|uniref:YwqG family protein n=1 Tax=Bacillus sp. 179-C3.3 HS TaxID=3232162 RepID=UPI0039A3D5D3
MSQSAKLQEKLAPYRPLLEETKKQAIQLHMKQGKTGPYDSKIAGDPYFPKNDEYPLDGEGHPMKLLAQINFGQLPKLKDYPETGLLQIFISVHDDLYGMNIDQKTKQKDFRIKFIAAPFLAEEELVTDFSFVTIPEDFYFPVRKEGAITGELINETISADDFRFEKVVGKHSWDLFEEMSDDDEEVEALMDEFYETESGFGHKVGGYPGFTQEDPRAYENQKHTLLLLQIDSDDEVDLMWGDCGIANFFITLEDLKQKNFENVVYNWDCS